MCVCNPNKYCNGNCQSFDKETLQSAIDMMSKSMARIRTLEAALGAADDVIGTMQEAIGKDSYVYNSNSSKAWHTYVLNARTQIEKTLKS